MVLVAQTINGEPKHNAIAPKVISRPASRMVTPSPPARSPSMPASPTIDRPVTKLPNINVNAVSRVLTGFAGSEFMGSNH